MSPKPAILMAAAVFLLTVLVRLPAAVLSWLLPAAVHCQSPSGTLWRGNCGELQSVGLTLTQVGWRLHPLALLGARLALDVRSEDPRAVGSAALSLHAGGRVELRDLRARLPLQGGLTPLPAGWSGQLELAIDQAHLERGHLLGAQGTVTARALHSARPAADLGSFELVFNSPGDTVPLVGTLHDLEGPLSLQGVLQLQPSGAYELNGSVAPRDPANAGLEQMLQLLGPTDAQGRHPFSLAGTL